MLTAVSAAPYVQVQGAKQLLKKSRIPVIVVAGLNDPLYIRQTGRRAEREGTDYE